MTSAIGNSGTQFNGLGHLFYINGNNAVYKQICICLRNLFQKLSVFYFVPAAKTV